MLYQVSQNNFIASSGQIDFAKLKVELQNSINVNIESISINENILIYFEGNGELTQEQINILNNVVANHNHLTYFKLTGKNTPIDELIKIQYDRVGLQKKKFDLVKGDLLDVEFYENYDKSTNIFSNLICKENNEFIYDENKFIEERRSKVDYYLNDGTIGYTYNFTHFYIQDFDKIAFTKAKRINIIEKAQAYLGTVLTIEQEKEILANCGLSIIRYEKGDGEDLEIFINNCTFNYLTTEIKTTLLDIITY